MSPYCFYLAYNYIHFDTSEGRTLISALNDWVWSINGSFRAGQYPKKIGRSFWLSTTIDDYEHEVYQIKKSRKGSLYLFILNINHDLIPGQSLGKTPYNALKNWLSKKDFGQDQVGEILDPEPVDEEMWQSSVMIGEMVALCWIALTDSGLRLV